MTTNPECESDTIDSYCDDPIPRLLYAKVTDDSGCSQFDGKVVQLLYDAAASSGSADVWTSDDDELIISYSVGSGGQSISSMCIGDFMGCSIGLMGLVCDDPYSVDMGICGYPCCGSVHITIDQFE